MLRKTLLPMLVLSISCFAQASRPDYVPFIRGEVHGLSPALGEDRAVELAPCDHRSQSQVVFLAADGSFEFRQVETGCYNVRVLAGPYRQPIYEENTLLNTHSATLELRIKTKIVARPMEGRVSARQLMNPPPARAIKALHDAQRFASKGETEKAIEQYHRTLDLHPSYAEAHVNLAVQLVQAGRLEEALTELHQARKLGMDDAILHTNFSAVYLQLNQTADAKREASIAIAQDPMSAKANYAMGYALIRTGGDVKETLDYLLAAEKEIPSARFLAALAHQRLGQNEQAVRLMKNYLKDCPKGNKEKVQHWIASMEPKQKQ